MDPCCVRRVYKVREQGRDVYVQTSEWACPWINPETGLREIRKEIHPEWDLEPLKASSNLADVLERRPCP